MTSLSVNTNVTPPELETFPESIVEAFRTGLVDTGIIFKLKIPFISPVHRHLVYNSDENFHTATIPSSMRQPLFGVLIDPFINHDLAGVTSPLVFPNTNWLTVNHDLTIHPYGLEHPLVRQSPSFVGWTGSLKYVFTITSSMIVQGEISIIRGKYHGTSSYKWKYPQLEYDEADNNQLVNLTTQRVIEKTVTYSANTPFINQNHYWQSMISNDYRNAKPMYAPRDYLFFRPNTDITTLSSQDGEIAIRMFLEPGPDFEWVLSSLPIRMDRFRPLTVVDKRFPFVTKESLICSVREVLFDNAIYRPIEIEDTKFQETDIFASAAPRIIRNLPSAGFVDLHKYSDTFPPIWQPIVGYSYGRLEPGSEKFMVAVNISGTEIPILTKDITTIVLGEVLLDIGFNYTPYTTQVPPFYFP